MSLDYSDDESEEGNWGQDTGYGDYDSGSAWDGGGDGAADWDGGASSAYDMGAATGDGASPYGDMFNGPLMTGMAMGAEPPELTPENPEIPEGIGQEYTVDPELEELAAKVARGEMTAEEAAAARAGAGAAAESGGILSSVSSLLTTIGSTFVNFIPPMPSWLFRGGREEA
ncbi:MAG TPA: hypothetical protein VKE22_18080 [Haliangiales bacterium]|nr:hypothetical protein [Haliangiales bacterium]